MKRINNPPSAKERPDSSVYSSDEQNMLYKLEEQSWWFQYRAKVIIGLLDRYFNKSIITTDIGGGNGFSTYKIAQSGYNAELLEPSAAACDNASKRGLNTICGELTEKYPEDGYYEQVMLLDVLEHIEEDNRFLELLKRKMKKGGLALITVPACMCLWNSQDVYAGHYRRYSLRSLSEMINKAGFRIVYINYFFSFLFLPHLFGRRVMEFLGLLKRNEDRTEKERQVILYKQFKQNQHSPILYIIKLLERFEYRRIEKNKKNYFGSSIISVIISE